MPLSNQHSSGVTMKVFAEVKKVTHSQFFRKVKTPEGLNELSSIRQQRPSQMGHCSHISEHLQEAASDAINAGWRNRKRG